jgi:hypothetical protein
MKKIIVLGVFFISFSMQILSSQEDSFIALALTGISYLVFKVGVERLHEYAGQKNTDVKIKKNSYHASNRSSFSSVSSRFSIEPLDVPVCLESQRLTPVNDKFRSLRGLIDAKRDTVYIPDTNTPSSVIDVDQFERPYLGDKITNQVPCWFIKKPVVSYVQPVLPVQQQLSSLVVRPLSPDEYVQVVAISPLSEGDREYEIVETGK